MKRYTGINNNKHILYFSITLSILLLSFVNIPSARIFASIPFSSALITAPEIQVMDGTTDIPDGTGSVGFGITTAGVSINRTFIVKNIGTSVLTLTPPITVPSGFGVTSGFGTNSLAVDSSTAFTIRFNASSTDTYSGTLSFANNDSDENPFDFTIYGTATTSSGPLMTIEQTISDGAQRTTLAFSGLALMTGNLEAQTFFPPGKVADYTGFQCLRDNDPDNMGHNTSFLTRVAYNVIFILNDTQFNQLVTLATTQMDQIDLYGYKRYPLMKAFRRLLEGDIPAGSTGLNLNSLKLASRELYILDGQISFDRALLYANVLNSMDSSQKAYLDDMKGKGWNSWPDITSAQVESKMHGLPQGTSVAVMTYAGDLFSWYAGSVEADVYFCPERQGTYYGGFYIKDAPAIGHEGYSIDEQLTATAGSALCDTTKGYVTQTQASTISSLVDIQRNNLYAGMPNIVDTRTQIATLLRTLLISTVASDAIKDQVLALSSIYGDLDGENNYYYATIFAQVYNTLTYDQKTNFTALRHSIMSGTYSDGTSFDFTTCTTFFLYSAIISDTNVLTPYIANTDYLFFEPPTAVLNWRDYE